MTPEPFLGAWHGDPDLKEKIVLRMKEHRAQDEFVQGNYQILALAEHGQYRDVLKGCAVGCMLEPVPREKQGEIDFSWHKEIQEQFGIDYEVAMQIDNLFEHGTLSLEAASEFAIAVVEAIPVGADLNEVLTRHSVNCAYNYGITDTKPRAYAPADCEECDYVSSSGPQKITIFLERLKNAPVPERG